MDKQTFLKDTIINKVFIENKDEQIGTKENPNEWIFDFRKVLLNGKVADTLSELFYEDFKDHYPFQLCALEIAGVPLVTSFMTKFYAKGYEDINAFFIRKSRKKSDLMRMIEGEIHEEQKIILVDDVMNRGNSFWRQIEVLDALGYQVDSVWSILRYRNLDYYQRFTERGIKVRSLFCLDDLGSALDNKVRNLVSDDQSVREIFEANWIMKCKDPSYNWVNPKSQPLLDNEHIYFGADNQHFMAIRQDDGAVAWSFRTGKGDRKKSVFSDPAFYDDLVIFGAYDGNLYALDRKTGAQRWVCFDADWIGSSPAVAEDLDMVFIGMEFGLVFKRGGIAALNAKTGEVIWKDYTHPSLTHSSPIYIRKAKEVIVGSNDGVVRSYDARSGALQWTFTTFGGANYIAERDHGFGEGAVKEGFAYDPLHDYVLFGALDGHLYILKRDTGTLVHQFKCDFAVWSTPCVYDNKVYFTSLDKNIRCLDLETFQLIFEKNLDGTRIFASPTVINDRLYVGTNAARLHEIDPQTGAHLGYFQTLERITNKLVHNEKTNTYFLPTYANEIISLTRVDDADVQKES